MAEFRTDFIARDETSATIRLLRGQFDSLTESIAKSQIAASRFGIDATHQIEGFRGAARYLKEEIATLGAEIGVASSKVSFQGASPQSLASIDKYIQGQRQSTIEIDRTAQAMQQYTNKNIAARNKEAEASIAAGKRWFAAEQAAREAAIQLGMKQAEADIAAEKKGTEYALQRRVAVASAIDNEKKLQEVRAVADAQKGFKEADKDISRERAERDAERQYDLQRRLDRAFLLQQGKSLTEEQRKQALAAHEVGNAIKGGADSSRTMVYEARHLVALFDEFKRGQFGAMFSTIGAALRDAGVGPTALFAGIGALAGAGAIIGAVEALKRWNDEAQKTIGQQSHFSAAIGISLSQFQEFSAVARLAGGSADSAANAMTTLQKKMLEAVMNSNGPIMEAFSHLGFSYEELRKKLSDPQGALQVLDKLRDSFHSMNAPDRTARFRQLFDVREFENIIPILEKDNLEIAQLTKRAQELASITPFAIVESLKESAKVSHELDVAWTAFKINVLGSSDMFDGMKKGLTDLLATMNRGEEVLYKPLTWRLRDWLKGDPSKTAVDRDVTTGTMVAGGAGNLVGRHESESLARRLGISPYAIGVGGTDLSNAPRDENGFPIWGGAGNSHAAGRYQFQPGTWAQYARPLGIKDFSPESQDTVFNSAFKDQGFKPWAPYNPSLRAALSGGYSSGLQSRAAPDVELPEVTATAARRDPTFNVAEAEKAYRAELEKAKVIAQEHHEMKTLNALVAEGEVFARKSADDRRKDLEARYPLGAEELKQRVDIAKAETATAQQKRESFLYDQQTVQATLSNEEAVARTRKNLETVVDIEKKRLALTLANPYETEANRVLARGRVAKAEAELDEQRIRKAEETYATSRRVSDDLQRGFKAEMQIKVDRREITPVQAGGFEIQEVGRLGGKQKESLDLRMKAADAAKDESAQLKIWLQQWELGVQTQTKILEIRKQIADEEKKIIDAWAQPFKAGFDKIGSSLESSLTALIDRSKTMQQIWADIGKSMVSAGIGIVGGTLSKVAGGLVGGKPGEGIDAALANMASNFIGKQISGMVSSTIGSTIGGTVQAAETTVPIVAAITSETAVVTSTLGAVATAIVTAIEELAIIESANFAKPSVLGTTFQHGGIVPSAAGGMIVPGNGTLSILHAREMVLPEHIATPMQDMLQNGGPGGNASFHFHGPADGPSIDRWFKGMVAGNPDSVRRVIRASRF